MIQDSEIKILINNYQTNQIHFNKIKELLSDFIYQFPAISFEVYDDDLKGEFYLFMMDRLEKVIQKYKRNESAQFKTYFYLVLRSCYLNFVRLRKKSKIKLVSLKDRAVSMDPDILDRNIDLEKVSLIFSSLPPRYRLILKLRCPDFLLPEDIVAIGREFKKDPVQLLNKLKIILEDVKKKEAKRIKAMRNQKDISREIPITSPKTIAHFLGVSANQVSKWLLTIKNIVHEKIGDLYVSR